MKLEARADRDEASETPIVEEGTEGVRIMTVHRAKGLEFPVVILADITCNDRGDAARHIDPASNAGRDGAGGMRAARTARTAEGEHRRDEEEAIRLLYVAATRARDLMVVPAVGDEECDGWLARLNPVSIRRRQIDVRQWSDSRRDAPNSATTVSLPAPRKRPAKSNR